MANIVTTADFVNFFALAKTQFTTTVLQDYIDRYHDFYIRKLLGVALGDLLIAELPTPVTPTLIAITDPFNEQDNSMIRVSRGLKDMLAGIIFYHYVFDQQTGSGQSGVSKKDIETGIVQASESAARFGESKWNNDVMTTWENIQWFCKTNPQDYPDFKGEEIQAKWSALI